MSANSFSDKKYRIYRSKETKLPMITTEIDNDMEYITEIVYDSEQKAANAALYHYKLEINFGGFNVG